MVDAAAPRVLVVEDDYLVATELATILRESGAQVLGPVASAAECLRIARQQVPDCVLLDINLRGELAFSLADELRARGIETIFTTGYDSSVLPERLQTSVCLRKPLDLPSLITHIRAHARRAPQA